MRKIILTLFILFTIHSHANPNLVPYIDPGEPTGGCDIINGQVVCGHGGGTNPLLLVCYNNCRFAHDGRLNQCEISLITSITPGAYLACIYESHRLLEACLATCDL